ncbi:unnamed protein product, partial [Prorocentrum cordatum]
ATLERTKGALDFESAVYHWTQQLLTRMPSPTDAGTIQQAKVAALAWLDSHPREEVAPAAKASYDTIRNVRYRYARPGDGNICDRCGWVPPAGIVPRAANKLFHHHRRDCRGCTYKQAASDNKLGPDARRTVAAFLQKNNQAAIQAGRERNLRQRMARAPEALQNAAHDLDTTVPYFVSESGVNRYKFQCKHCHRKMKRADAFCRTLEAAFSEVKKVPATVMQVAVTVWHSNVQVAPNQDDLRSALRHATRMDADVVVLTETYWDETRAKERVSACCRSGHAFAGASHTTTPNTAGVAIYGPAGTRRDPWCWPTSLRGRVASAVLRAGSTDVLIIGSVHGHSGTKRASKAGRAALADALAVRAAAADLPAVMVADWNAPPDDDDDYSSLADCTIDHRVMGHLDAPTHTGGRCIDYSRSRSLTTLDAKLGPPVSGELSAKSPSDHVRHRAEFAAGADADVASLRRHHPLAPPASKALLLEAWGRAATATRLAEAAAEQDPSTHWQAWSGTLELSAGAPQHSLTRPDGDDARRWTKVWNSAADHANTEEHRQPVAERRFRRDYRRFLQYGNIQGEDAALSASLAKSLGPLVSDGCIPHPSTHDDAVCSVRRAIRAFEEEVIQSRLNECLDQYFAEAARYAAPVRPRAERGGKRRLEWGRFTVAGLMAAARGCRGTAAGPADYDADFLLSTPTPARQHLADLADKIMGAGIWPDALRAQNATFIPKISSQAAVAARIADNLPTVACASDLASCFNHIDPSSAERAAVLRGMPDTRALFLFSVNVDKPTMFRGGKCAMRAPPPDSGLAQGDPSSPLGAAAVAATHKAILESTVDGQQHFDAHVDDRAALTNSLEAD